MSVFGNSDIYSILLFYAMIFFPVAILKAFMVFEKGNANCLPLNMFFLDSKMTFINFRFLGQFSFLSFLACTSGLSIYR